MLNFGKVRQIGDSVLKTVAQPYVVDDKTGALAERMHVIMRSKDGVGLAGPQIGLSARVFVYDLRDGTTRGFVANPVLSAFEGEVDQEEGCLSVPGRVRSSVRRAYRVHLDGVDEHGERVSVDAEGLLARVFQHEVDHLDGRLFLSRLPVEESRRLQQQALLALDD